MVENPQDRPKGDRRAEHIVVSACVFPPANPNHPNQFDHVGRIAKTKRPPLWIITICIT